MYFNRIEWNSKVFDEIEWNGIKFNGIKKSIAMNRIQPNSWESKKIVTKLEEI